MSNDDVYAAGLLNRALDPATQPLTIQAFLRAEIDLPWAGNALLEFEIAHAGAAFSKLGCKP